jgi:hypothetical protein
MTAMISKPGTVWAVFDDYAIGEGVRLFLSRVLAARRMGM